MKKLILGGLYLLLLNLMDYQEDSYGISEDSNGKLSLVTVTIRGLAMGSMIF